MSSAKKITLKSSDGEAFEVDEAVALESQTIKHMIEDDCSDSGILLPKVTSKILAKVIEYCKKHVEVANSEDKPSEDDLKAWDADFVKVDRDTLFDLIQAAHYLKIQSLLDLTCDTVLYMIKGKTPEEVYMFLSRDETRIHAKLVATVGGTSLDLHRLFVEVTSRGGIEKVIVERKWKEVILTFNFKDTIMSASFVVRKSYLSMLYHYEQVYYFGRQGIPPPTPDLMIRGQSGQPYSSTTIPEVAAVNDSPVQSTPVQAHDDMVSGTIDAKFDGGYVVTVTLGSEQLKGVLFHVPDNVSQSSHAEGTSSSQNLRDGMSNSESKESKICYM